MEINKLDVALVRKLTGVKVVNLRLAAGLSQEQASIKAGMTRQNLCNIERGHISLSAFSCIALCLFFKVTPAELYPTLEELEAGHVAPIRKARPARRKEMYVNN